MQAQRTRRAALCEASDAPNFPRKPTLGDQKMPSPGHDTASRAFQGGPLTCSPTGSVDRGSLDLTAQSGSRDESCERLQTPQAADEGDAQRPGGQHPAHRSSVSPCPPCLCNWARKIRSLPVYRKDRKTRESCYIATRFPRVNSFHRPARSTDAAGTGTQAGSGSSSLHLAQTASSNPFALCARSPPCALRLAAQAPPHQDSAQLSPEL